jgi:hypothetical protein
MTYYSFETFSEMFRQESLKKISLVVNHPQKKQTNAVVSVVSYTHWTCTELITEMAVLVNCTDS